LSIQTLNEQALKLGEEEQLEEVEVIMNEIEKLRKQKTELEALLD
jgi:CRISPR/Cas system-associated protein Cas10 (large subunit of type III CRISPR-Cas system)